ncbi:MAG: HAMP domain-containing sensor histidine kinase [Myxococcota bacterium]
MTGDGWWTARLATFVAIVASSSLAALALAELSADALEDSLDRALSDHLRAEAALFAASVAPEPLEAVALIGQGQGADALGTRLDGLTTATGLHDAVVFAPDGGLLGRERSDPWLAARADAALVVAARLAPTAGTLYRTDAGELYQTAYAPVPGHPGFVVGVEGTGETLRAVDELETMQLYAGLGVAAVGALLGVVLSVALSRPLSRLEREVSALAPGSAPGAIAVQGPREVRRVARSVQSLLAAIRERDVALEGSHAARLAEVTTLAATVAHEVRNPANALGIILRGIRSADGPARREQLVARGEGCVREIEGIVERFLDLSRPITPTLAACDLRSVCRAAAAEVEAELHTEVRGGGAAHVDAELLGQVLRNLLRNAVEAGASRATLTVEGPSIVASDDGPGIATDDAERVFEWFHTTRAQGTGLGLPLSRRICRVLGGDLVLVSARPATFRIELQGASS